ncbi:hypothetical protein [Holdemanella biformis]|uniref:hypothetical protein n=1 Tax=Holdemanella biformis TaxID=1735 RepID=UPI002490613B|nr:hypothetical protein [Holdemanella biformis]
MKNLIFDNGGTIMLKQTDLTEIKNNVSLPFLYLDIEPTNIPFCVFHPYLETSTVAVALDKSKPMDSHNMKIADILTDKEAYVQWREMTAEKIQNAITLRELYIMVRKSYRLTFLKYAKKYMSSKDFSTYLADAWVSSENPSQDANCSLGMLISWFEQADKKILMETEDYQVYVSLPDELRIYRGVTLGREPNGLSWTSNLETAKWFAHRYDRGNNQGYVEAAIVKKEEVLAYFNTRGEDELVVNVRNLEIEVITKK